MYYIVFIVVYQIYYIYKTFLLLFDFIEIIFYNNYEYN